MLTFKRAEVSRLESLSQYCKKNIQSSEHKMEKIILKQLLNCLMMILRNLETVVELFDDDLETVVELFNDDA